MFRRLAAALAADAVGPPVGPQLEADGQLGLAKAGPQRFLLRAQTAVDRGWALAKLDVANAYNTLERTVAAGVARDLAARNVGVTRAAAAVLCNLYSDGEEVFARTDAGPVVVR